jgi:hypothetical protein
MSGRAAAPAAALLLAACGTTEPSSTVEPRFGIEIRLAHGSRAEQRTRDQLLGLIGRHALLPWLVTRAVLIDEDAVSHSHPVLTLSTRHQSDDGLLLASFVHEQLHWFLLAREAQGNAALAEILRLYPQVPVEPPEGAGTLQSTYLHILIGWMELDATTRLLGPVEAERVITFWTRDHYRWVYRTVLADRARLEELIVRHGLRVG